MEIGPTKEYEFEPVIIPAVEPVVVPAEAPAEQPVEPAEPTPELEPAQ